MSFIKFLEVKYLEFVSSTLQIQLNTSKPLYIFDLDNTLVDTRTFQKKMGKIDCFDYKDFPSISNRAKVFVDNCSELGEVIILTARPYKLTSHTNNFLKSNKMNYKVILTRTAENKLIFLKKFSRYFEEIYYYDDLTFGIESIGFYKKVIERVLETPKVKYFDEKFIKANIL